MDHQQREPRQSTQRRHDRRIWARPLLRHGHRRVPGMARQRWRQLRGDRARQTVRPWRDVGSDRRRPLPLAKTRPAAIGFWYCGRRTGDRGTPRRHRSSATTTAASRSEDSRAACCAARVPGRTGRMASPARPLVCWPLMCRSRHDPPVPPRTRRHPAAALSPAMAASRTTATSKELAGLCGRRSWCA